MTNSRMRLERETVIVYNEAEDEATIWSASQKTIRRLEKFGFIATEGTKEAKYFKVPKRLVSLRSPSKRVMTEENKEKAAQRMKKFQKDKKLQNA